MSPRRAASLERRSYPDARRTNGEPFQIVGESFHQDVLEWARKMESEHATEFWITLTPEPENKYDRNAIRVDLILPDGSTRPVGHIAKRETAEWHDVIRSAPPGVTWCWPAETTGGNGSASSVGLQFLC